MKLKAFANIERIIVGVIVVFLAIIILSSTKSAFNKARESKTRNQITTLGVFFDYLIKEKVDLLEFLPNCKASGAWCQTDNSTNTAILVDSSKSPVPFYNGALRDGRDEYIKFRATGEDSYLIYGLSVKSHDLCWIGSSSDELSNLNKNAPSQCPQ